MGAHRILPRLWQGSAPPEGGELRRRGFEALVLAAEEHQPPAECFRHMRVHHAPLDDHLQPLTAEEWDRIIDASMFAYKNVMLGRKTLVTCQMGINRSGIITAMTVCQLAGVSGRAAVDLIQRQRPGALLNTSFVRQIERAMA
jgi:protein-tyrosine phosphatase